MSNRSDEMDRDVEAIHEVRIRKLHEEIDELKQELGQREAVIESLEKVIVRIGFGC